MTTETKVPMPEGMHQLSPHLICAGAAEAIDFYKKAFGAVEYMRLPAPDGKIMHAMVGINGSSVMLVDENRDYGLLSPQALSGTPVTIHLIVPDVDGFMAHAAEAGAIVAMPAADMFWGDRYGVLQDPFGHRWSIATPKQAVTLSMDELQQAATEAAQAGEHCGA